MYPYGAPGAPVSLAAGHITIAGQTREGEVELRLSPDLGVIWRSKPFERLALKPAELQLSTRTGGTVNLHGVCDRTGTNGSGGRLETVNLGAADAAMENVLVHWFNAPLVRPLEDIYDDSDHRVHLGRLVATFPGWTITMDRRPDYDEVWKSALNMGSVVMTHTMQIRREDGAAPFTATEVEPVIDALQFGLSFAVGRWAAPALLVGFDHKGHRVWEQWAARHCTPGDPGPLRWWTEMLTGDLIELLERLVQRFSDPDERFSLRFLMASAVHSAAGGFVEQRIMTAFAAIEHLMWKRLVTVGGMSKTKYKAKDFPASEKLTLVLNEAKIRNDIDAGALPSLYREMQKQEEESNRTWPFIACRIRNMIVHPTDYEERLYRSGDGVVLETWLLVHHYLLLLTLHHIGYKGSYQRQLPPGGWAGDVEPVPWTSPESNETRDGTGEST
jgi:hypothetical protein